MVTTSLSILRTAAATAAVVVFGAASISSAQYQQPTAGDLDGAYESNVLNDARAGAGIDEKLGDKLPLDAVFTDSDGNQVTLGDAFDGDKPVVLQLAYYRCPALCGEVMNGMVKAMGELSEELTIGDDFDVLTVSFDSRESAELAQSNKDATVDVMARTFDKEQVAAAWGFWVGTDLSIERLTEAAGFNFVWVPEAQAYSHTGTIIILTPDGKVSRYLQGPNFDAQAVRLSVVDASDGKLQPSLKDAFVYYCFSFDPHTGKYTAGVRTVMMLGGVAVMLTLFGVIGFLVYAERRGRLGRHPMAGTPAEELGYLDRSEAPAPPADRGGASPTAKPPVNSLTMSALPTMARLLLLVLALGLVAPASAQDAEEDVRPVIRQADENAVRKEVNDAAGVLLDGDDKVIDVVTTVRGLAPELPAQKDTGFLENPLTWMPQDAASRASDVDFMFDYILWVSVFFTVLVIAAMVWFAIKYRARSDDEPDPVNVSTHSTTLEITWTVIPTCIVLVMFVFGFRGYLNDTIAPPNALKINVIAASWYWTFEYPDGSQTNHLYLPKDRPVEFTLKSQDVIHSIYIPAFRMKKDVVPGRFNRTWATPTETGIFELFCTEYCGQKHSRMGAKVFVFEPDRFEEVFAVMSNPYEDPTTGEPKPPAEVGEYLYSARGCIGCHSVDGTAGTGPSWLNLWNAPDHAMADGEVVEVNEDYIRESIYYPSRKIVARATATPWPATWASSTIGTS